mgnify:CR=1 FL=1
MSLESPSGLLEANPVNAFEGKFDATMVQNAQDDWYRIAAQDYLGQQILQNEFSSSIANILEAEILGSETL